MSMHPMDAMDWRHDAACATADPALFISEDRQYNAYSVRTAKRICGECPVRADCGAYALDHAVPGIWGGTTEHERRKLRRQRRLEKDST